MRAFDQPEPLTAAEVEHLGEFLRECKGGKAMNIEEVDGFFSAPIAGPEVVMPSEYLPEVFKSDAQFDPMPPPMYHPERGEPPVPLWANKPEPGPSTRIPQTEDAMNDARRINVNNNGVRVAMERKPGVFASFRRAIRVPALHFAGL